MAVGKDIYLSEAEYADLTEQARRRRTVTGVRVSVPVALPGLRLLPMSDGSYARWTVERLTELRGATL